MNFFLPRTLKLPFYFVLAVGLLLPVPSRGQDADQATFIINANIEKLHAQLAKLEIDLNELFQTSEIPVLEAIKLSEVKSIRGEVSTPRPMEQRESERVPSDFRFLVEFKTEQACAKIIEFMEDRGTKEQINGQTCFTSPDGEFPVMVKVAGAAKLEYGTVAYLNSTADSFATPALKKGSNPDVALEVGIDFEAMDGAFDDFFAMVPDLPEGDIEQLLSAIGQLHVELDLEAPVVARFSLTAEDESNVEVLETQSTILTRLAKTYFDASKAMMVAADPDAAQGVALLDDLLDEMKVVKNGNRVSIEFEKLDQPKALVDVLSSIRKGSNRASKLNNFRQCALAVHNYVASTESFPFAEDDEWSWRVRILRYMESGLAGQMNQDESPDHPDNGEFATQMPEVFGQDRQRSNIAWIKSSVKHFRDITDGTSNTIMLIENPNGRPWLNSNPLTIDEAVELVKSLGPGETLAVAMYDGSVRTISSKIEETALRNLFDPADDNPVDWDEIDN